MLRMNALLTVTSQLCSNDENHCRRRPEGDVIHMHYASQATTL
jgi:hypothetical protein